MSSDLVIQVLLGGGMLTTASALVFKAYMEGRRTLRDREVQLRGMRGEVATLANALNEHSLVTITNPAGIIIDVNERFLKCFGYERMNIIGHTQNQFHVADALTKSDEIQATTSQGKIWTGDLELRRADGNIALTQCTIVPLMDENGNHEKTITLWTDVTKTRRTEAESLMTVGFEKMPVTVFIFDPKSYKICYMNGHAGNEQGWDKSQCQNKTFWDMDYQTDNKSLARTLEGLADAPCVTLPLTRVNQDKAFDAQFFQISAKGPETRILAVVQDVTSRVAAQRRQKELVSVIAHELRTPLTSIKGAIKLLAAGAVGDMPAKANNLIGIADKNSERMLLLINDLLSLEKIESADFTFDVSPVDTAQLIEDVINSHRSYGLDLGVQFVRSGAKGTCFVMGNEDRLIQVLSNLMSNAAKFSSFGGQVEVGLEDSDAQEAVIFVKDHGAGIPEKDHATLFERFTQAKNTGISKIEGSGLGLSIVRSLVEKHGGSVDFESELGKGTTFRVHLPKALPPDATEQPSFGSKAA